VLPADQPETELNQSPDEITAYLHTQIPISLHMGVRIVELDELSIRIAAPLAPNINHRDTFFGGSISGLGILAGWTLLHLNLVRAGYEHRLVVQHSETDYQAPAESEVETTCALASPADWDRFVRTLARRGKARIHLSAQALVPPNTIIAEHQLAYVAMLIER
jgi:thioesterase domain-containing protein